MLVILLLAARLKGIFGLQLPFSRHQIEAKQ